MSRVSVKAVRHLRVKHFRSAWLGTLWSLALLGLFLLPSDYRAGGELAHGHSLVELWIDAADGYVHHHHAGPGTTQAAVQDWLDPTVSVPDADGADPASAHAFDVGEYHDSTPASGGVHLMLASLTILPVVSTSRQFVDDPEQALTGRNPSVLLPPPRWTPSES